jgi:hypothetical protein
LRESEGKGRSCGLEEVTAFQIVSPYLQGLESRKVYRIPCGGLHLILYASCNGDSASGCGGRRVVEGACRSALE